MATLLLAATVLLSGCAELRDDREPTVVATIYPLADLTRQVLGDAADVKVLLPPGRTPHGFELTPRRLRDLHHADAVVTVGTSVDRWAAQAAENLAQSPPLITMADLLDIKTPDADHTHHNHHHHDEAHADHAHDRAGPDPHLWIDPVLTRRFVEALGPRLASIYPEHAETIKANTAALLASLDELDQAYRESLEGVERRELITFHSAFDRLAERYGLRVVAHLVPLDAAHGGEVTARRLDQAARAVREHGLSVVYAEPQFPERAVDWLRRETGIRVLRLDPLGHPDRDGYHTYQETMQSNLATLTDGQGG